MQQYSSSPTGQRRRRRVAAVSLSSAAAIALAFGLLGSPLANSAPTEPPANAAVANLNLEPGYADLVEAIKPAVVNVKVERDETADVAQNEEGGPQGSPFNDPQMRHFFERFFGQQMPQQAPDQQPEHHMMRGEGSGFIIDPSGLIVTNAHVAGGADKIQIVMQDGTQYKATLKGIDEKTDLALLKIDAKDPLPYVVFGDSSKVRVGDRVIAIGNPYGLGGTVTQGIVSATSREIGSGPYDDFLQVDAPINRGNSGGPTFNLHGEVIGINSAIFSPSGGNIGIGFAISSNLAKDIITQLEDNGTVQRGWLGVSIQPLDEDLATGLGRSNTDGALVAKVEPNTPAESAGVKAGDLILSYNGEQIKDLRDLTRAVADTDPGKDAKIEIWRDGKEETLTAQIAKSPATQQVASNDQSPAADQPRLGMALAPLTPQIREKLNLDGDAKGVVVERVVPDSPADQKGIRAGDVIVAAAGKDVRTPQQVVDAVRKAHGAGAKSIVMLIQRDGQPRYEAIPFAQS
jgi:serine protease Do